MSEPVVGIDLGTSTTVIAMVKGNTAHVIPDAKGNRVHPSVVSFHSSGEVLVGAAATKRRIVDPVNTVFSAKRLIGASCRSAAVKALLPHLPYQVVEGDNEQPLILCRDQEYTVPEIAAYVLRYVKGLAEKYVGEPISKAVITVPANFTDAQRAATKSAGQIAGLEVLRILNEPTAAALAYGYGQGMSSSVAIYDFGGGTFDVTMLRLDDRVFEVLSTAGDPYLGGDDIDEVLVGFMIDMFLKETGIDLSPNPLALSRLRSVAEQVKRQLSLKARAVVKIKEIAHNADGSPLDIDFVLTREELSRMSQETVQRTFLICDEALGLAALSATQLDSVVLVGGSTRMPLVREMVGHYFGSMPHVDINPDEVVAVGAAIQAASLARAPSIGGAAKAVLLDVTPRAIGIKVVGGYAETVIERNAQIPVEQTRVFSTSSDNQQQVRLQVCQGESNIFAENQLLGELLLEELRAARRGEVKIEVTFEVDTDGILQVQAIDQETGRAQLARMQVLGTLPEGQAENLRLKQEDKPAIAEEPAVDLPASP